MFGSSQYITTSMYRRYWQAWPSATSYWNALQWSQVRLPFAFLCASVPLDAGSSGSRP